MTETLPEPASRKEQYLAKAAGMSGITLPTPASREELYLNAIALNGGGGGGGGDYTFETFTFTLADGTTVAKSLAVESA